MIRTWRPGDVPEVAALDRELFGADGWDVASWQALLAASGRRAWVAGPGLQGYALSGLGGDFAELLRIAVRPGVRRRGLASALLAAVVEAAGTDGADRVLLEVSEANATARAFYARHGFVEIDRRPRYYADGSTALVLSADVPAGDGTVGPSGRMDP